MNSLEDYLSKIDTPALIVDSEIMQKNIESMAKFAKQQKINLRPHTKTHKCPELAKRQLQYGAVGIAVAKVSEAEVMAKAGINDIQIANEVVGETKIKRLLKVMESAKMTIAVDNYANVEMLSELMQKNHTSVDVLIDINVGLNRCGFWYGDYQQIFNFAECLESRPGINLKGIMCHAGQAYKCNNIEEVEKIGLFEGRKMDDLARYLRIKGVKCETVSVGSTPTARFAGTVEGVTEIRPGNYIFYDNIQASMGVVNYSRCALKVLSSVISVPADDRVIIDAGSKTLALDTGAHGSKSIEEFGYLLGRKAKITHLSEEHGFIEKIGEGEKFKLDEKILIIPNHACTAVNLSDKIVSPREGKEYQIEARGCNQ